MIHFVYSRESSFFVIVILLEEILGRGNIINPSAQVHCILRPPTSPWWRVCKYRKISSNWLLSFSLSLKLLSACSILVYSFLQLSQVSWSLQNKTLVFVILVKLIIFKKSGTPFVWLQSVFNCSVYQYHKNISHGNFICQTETTSWKSWKNDCYIMFRQQRL